MKGAENGAQLGLDIGRVASFANEKVDFLFALPQRFNAIGKQARCLFVKFQHARNGDRLIFLNLAAALPIRAGKGNDADAASQIFQHKGRHTLPFFR